MITISKKIKPMEVIPKGYGVAYKEFDRMCTVCYPLPFNWIVGWIRDIWYRLMRGHNPNWEEQLIERISKKVSDKVKYDFNYQTNKRLWELMK